MGADGKMIWTRQDRVDEMAMAKGTVFLANWDRFWIVDVETGDTPWSTSYRSISSPLLVGKTDDSFLRIGHTAGQIYAHKLDLDWKRSVRGFRTHWLHKEEIRGTPLVHKSVVCCLKKDGTIVALDLATGELLWRSRLEITPADFRPQHWKQPKRQMIALGKYIGIMDARHSMHLISLRTGKRITELPLVGDGEKLSTLPWVQENHLIVPTFKVIRAYRVDQMRSLSHLRKRRFGLF
jgi:hypothetical protein